MGSIQTLILDRQNYDQLDSLNTKAAKTEEQFITRYAFRGLATEIPTAMEGNRGSTALDCGGTYQHYGLWVQSFTGYNVHAGQEGRIFLSVGRAEDTGEVSKVGLWLDSRRVYGQVEVKYLEYPRGIIPELRFRGTGTRDLRVDEIASLGLNNSPIDGVFRIGRKSAIRREGLPFDGIWALGARVRQPYTKPILLPFDNLEYIKAIIGAQIALGYHPSLNEYDMYACALDAGLPMERVPTAMWYLTHQQGPNVNPLNITGVSRFGDSDWDKIIDLMEKAKNSQTHELPRLPDGSDLTHIFSGRALAEIDGMSAKLGTDNRVVGTWKQMIGAVIKNWSQFELIEKEKLLHFFRTHFCPEILFTDPIPSMVDRLKQMTHLGASLVPALLLTLGVAFLSSSAWAGENASTEVEPSNWLEEAESFAKSFVLGEALSRLGPLGVAASFFV